MASSTRTSAFTFGSPVENPHTSARSRAFNYTEYVPDSETLPDAYTYVADAVLLQASLSSGASIAGVLSDSATLLHASLSSEASITGVLSDSAIQVSAGLHRIVTEVLSPYVEPSAGLHRIITEILSPYVEPTVRRRPVTFLILD